VEGNAALDMLWVRHCAASSLATIQAERRVATYLVAVTFEARRAYLNGCCSFFGTNSRIGSA
jgi:hypothetical protein